MADHLSALVLDELAAGQADAAASAHVQGCADCRARLDAVMAAADVVRGAPEFLARLGTLEPSTIDAAPSPVVSLASRRWLRVVAVAVPLAAALAVFFLVPRGEEPRLKGQTTVELLSASGAPVLQAAPGERLSLAVGGAGHTHAVVFSVDAMGEVAQVWPPGAQAAPISTGARARLEPPLEVTPGSVVLIAYFTDAAAPVTPLAVALRQLVAEEVRAGHSPLDVPAPQWPAAAARVKLEVAR